MVRRQRMKDDEGTMEYKYYGHFTTKEKHIFKELIFHSSMIYNKVNWYFLNHKFDAKMQPNIVDIYAIMMKILRL